MVIYCSGIGGIGLSAYAALQKNAGNVVRGSDRADSALIQDLREQGIEVFLEQDGSHVTSDIDLFVYSEAVPVDAPERKKATELGIPQKSYFHALGDLCEPYDVIAICGTHGKSSTTAMVAKILIDAGLDPTVVVGTKSPDLGGRNWRKGNSNLFVVEACEYRKSFHYISPDMVALTTVDGDHFDAFSSIEEYREAFVEFLKRLPEEKSVIIHGSDKECVKVASSSGKTVIDADQIPLPSVGIPGEHMRQNARLAIAIAKELGVTEDVATTSLKTFRGTWRRMEVLGETKNGVAVVDDYAHHPAEIRATLSAMREAYPTRRIVCVFQPHTHDRTLKLYDEFLPSFKDSNLVIVSNVYNARSDIEHGEVDLPRFISDIARESGVEVRDGKSLNATLDLLRSELQFGDVVITMGAGDITSLASKILAL